MRARSLLLASSGISSSIFGWFRLSVPTRPSMISSSRNLTVTMVAFPAPELPICGPRGSERQRHYNEPFAELLRKNRGRVTKLENASESLAGSARLGAMIPQRLGGRDLTSNDFAESGWDSGSDASCPGAIGPRPDPRLSARRRRRLRYALQAIPQG